ncbi:hypothetical protein [Streptomyces mirabilis]
MGRSTRGLVFPRTSSPPSPSRAQDFASLARKAIADPNVELHVDMTGLERFGDFMDAAKRGLPAGEADHSTDYEMSLIARAVANGQRAWSSVKFYSAFRWHHAVQADGYAGSVKVGETQARRRGQIRVLPPPLRNPMNMDAHRKDLYPDVTASGGLGPAMRGAAQLRGCDTGLGPWAVDVVSIQTARGFLSVDPATEERLFRLSVGIPGFDWEIGSTGDLGLLVEAVAAWREGIPLDELEERFEFMELDEFVGALERGEPTSSQWAELLSSDFNRRQWNLLRRLRADEVLRDMFPTISHCAVRLCVDAMDGRSRQVLVDEVNGELYEVMRVGVPGASWVEVPAGDLIAYLRAALNEE